MLEASALKKLELTEHNLPPSALRDSHILVDGYELILHQWSLAVKEAEKPIEPNKIYLAQLRKQIEQLLDLKPKSITFYLDAVVTRPFLHERLERKQKLLSCIEFDDLISPRLLTLTELMNFHPKLELALCDMETEHIILYDIAKLKAAKTNSPCENYLIVTKNERICAYDFVDTSNVMAIPADRDPGSKLTAYSYAQLKAVLFSGVADEKLPPLLGRTLRSPKEVACRRLEFENSVFNNCPVILLPVIPFVDNINPYDVGSVYRRCAYGSFLARLGLPPDTHVDLYHQEHRKYLSHPLRPLDQSICKAHAHYWSQPKRGTDFCDELIGFVSPDAITSVGRYLNDLIAGKPMRTASPCNEAKQAVSYLSALFYSLCVLSECEFSFSPRQYTKLLAEINPSHLASYLRST